MAGPDPTLQYDWMLPMHPYLEQIKTFENEIPYLYLDAPKPEKQDHDNKTGNVTVGYGHNLTAELSRYGAQPGQLEYFEHLSKDIGFNINRLEREHVIGGNKGVPFTHGRKVGDPATAAEIRNDFDFLTQHKRLGFAKKENREKYTTVVITKTGMEKLFLADVDMAKKIAEQVFGKSAFARFPLPCRAGLIDMAFNMGNFDKFSTFKDAVGGQGAYKSVGESKRWEAAAQHCHRILGEDKARRNETVAGWFRRGQTEVEIRETQPTLRFSPSVNMPPRRPN